MKAVLGRGGEPVHGDGVTRMHDERVIWPGTIRKHRVERRGFMKHALLSRRRQAPNRRADGIAVWGELHLEAPALRAAGYDGVRVKLQLNKRLAEDAFGVRYRAAKPKSRPGRGYGEGAAGWKHDGPGQLFRGTWEAGNGIKFGFVVARAARVILHFKDTFDVFRPVREASGLV